MSVCLCSYVCWWVGCRVCTCVGVIKRDCVCTCGCGCAHVLVWLRDCVYLWVCLWVGGRVWVGVVERVFVCVGGGVYMCGVVER